jgi:coatomer protein complex subunit alpha (xenin)
VRRAALDPLRSQFAKSGDDFKVTLWDYTSGEVVHTFSHPNYVRSLEYHPRRPWLLGASDDLTASIVDVERRERLCQLTGHEHFVMSARFHPREPRVTTMFMDRSARVWLLKETRLSEEGCEMRLSGIVVAEVAGHGKALHWAEFHPRLPLIVAAGDDGNDRSLEATPPDFHPRLPRFRMRASRGGAVACT